MKRTEPNQTSLPEKVKQPHYRGARTVFALTALSVACGGAMNALAQDQETSAGQLEEVVVTATRRAESQQDVAISMTALTGNYLDQRGISAFSDLTKAAAGLDLVQVSNATGSALRMRGVGVRPNSPLDSSVGVLQDEVYQARPGFSFQEMMDVERVEVLRGPQGTLFGKNTIAGVIKITTNAPDLEEFSGRVQGVGGNDSNVEGRGVVNIPIIDGKLAARISGFDAQRDGYTENVFANEDTRNMDRWGGRAKLRWAPIDAVTTDLSYEKNKSKSDQDSGMVIYGPTSLTDLAGKGLDPADFPVELGKAQQDIRGRSEDEIERYLGRIEWDTGDHILKLLGAYEKLTSFVYNDQNINVTNTGLGAITNNNSSDINTIEMQLVSNLDGPVSYILGTFYQQNQLESLTNLYVGSGATGYNIIPRPISAATNKSLAGFGNISYEFTDQIKASFGARYTDDQKENTGAPGNYKDFKEWTYSGDVQYRFSDDVMAYIAAQKGFTSGGFNRPDVVAVLGPEFNSFEPVTTKNYEIGIKSEWFDNRARLNASIFTQEYDDYQITQTVTGAATVAISNAAKVKSQGIETDFAWAATDNLTFDGTLAYFQTEYDEYTDAPCAFAIPGNPPQVSPAGCTQQPGGTFSQDLSGETLDNAPEWSGNVGVEYRMPIDSFEWFARADVTYRDDTLQDINQAPTSAQGSYELYSARIGLTSPDQGWTVTLWGNNLSDEDYSVDSIVNAFGTTRTQGLTQTYGVTADYVF